MDKQSKIYIAGHNGMVGSAIHRKLIGEGYNNIITENSNELDLREQSMVRDFFSKEQPEYVVLSAAMVGGIQANNTYRGDFLYNNLIIQTNIIHESYVNKVKKLVFMGSACIYPKLAEQPMKEEYMLTGLLEPTNEPYAIAKIAGLKMCEAYNNQYGCNFISVMPNNLYGPNDNYDLNNSHVLAALIRKFHDAKVASKEYVELWGTGSPLREFLHVDDLAKACYFLMLNYNESQFINIGTGEEVSIKTLANLIKDVTEYKGELRWDDSKPDGVPRKLLDTTKLRDLGFQHSIKLKDGLTSVYTDLVDNYEKYTNRDQTKYLN
ncbi:MAG: GDP-L-fucose synthase [Bacteroidia bacterium]|nr:GDP-L-fucose synthase [Bacteroidia bacterium]